MPAYKNRPDMGPETPVWRYLDLIAVEATLRHRKLRFTRVDTFDDKFEGSVPKQTIDDQVPIFAGAYFMRQNLRQVAAHFHGMAKSRDPDEDPWARITRLRRAKTRSAHACCWAAGDESEALWRLYAMERERKQNPEPGVAFCTTLSRLEASVAQHDLYVSPVIYRPYHTGPAFRDELDSFMHKRRGFAAEREVRLLKLDDAQYAAQIQIPPATADLPTHILLDWATTTTIEQIVLSPYADEAYEQHARAAIAAADPTLADRIVLSELSPRRYAPGF